MPVDCAGKNKRCFVRMVTGKYPHKNFEGCWSMSSMLAGKKCSLSCYKSKLRGSCFSRVNLLSNNSCYLLRPVVPGTLKNANLKLQCTTLKRRSWGKAKIGEVKAATCAWMWKLSRNESHFYFMRFLEKKLRCHILLQLFVSRSEDIKTGRKYFWH